MNAAEWLAQVVRKELGTEDVVVEPDQVKDEYLVYYEGRMSFVGATCVTKARQCVAQPEPGFLRALRVCINRENPKQTFSVFDLFVHRNGAIRGLNDHLVGTATRARAIEILKERMKEVPVLAELKHGDNFRTARQLDEYRHLSVLAVAQAVHELENENERLKAQLDSPRAEPEPARELTMDMVNAAAGHTYPHRCPRCGSPALEGVVRWYCSNRECEHFG